MFKKITAILISAAAVVLLAASAFALGQDNVEVNNNLGKRDVVKVHGLEPRSTVSVFDDKGTLLGKRTTTNVSTTATVAVALPSKDAGAIRVTVANKDATNVVTIQKPYDAEPVTEAPLAQHVTVTNNVDKKDTILVDYVETRDIVTVYSAAEGGKKLASGRVRKNSDEITLSHKQLGTDGGSVWVTVTRVGEHESPRTEVKFNPETKSDPIVQSDVEITNNVNKKGVIEVSGLVQGDVITVFNADGTRKLGSAKCGRNKDTVKITCAQLAADGGNLMMTIKNNNKLPSIQTSVTYLAQPTSPAPNTNGIKIETNRTPAGTADSLNVSGLDAGDIVKVYINSTTTSVLMKGTVGSNKSDITLSRNEFAKEHNSVTLYISITRKTMRESARVAVYMPSVTESDELDSLNVTVANNAAIQSTIFVPGLYEGVTITAYTEQTGGRSLGSAKVAAGGNSATISLALNRDGGTVWLARRDPKLAESKRIPVIYGAQEKSKFENLSVSIVNNVGAADTITISGNIREGDIIKAYGSDTTGTVLGQATCGAQDYSLTITIGQLGKDTGEVYLTVTNKGKLESSRVAYDYQGEKPSSEISPGNATVKNNVNTAPTIELWGLNSGDVITVYDAPTGSRQLGKGTVETYATSVKFNLAALGAEAGSVYVSRKSEGLNESARTAVPYGGQMPTSDIIASQVTIVNNAGISDVITVTGLVPGDTIRAYSSQSATDPIAEGVALGEGATATAILPVSQLGTGSGTVYISRAHAGHSESRRVAVNYAMEKVSDRLSDVTVIRHATTVEFRISGLESNDIIRVYDAAKSSVLSSASSQGGSVTISITVNSTASGSVHITRQSRGMHESESVSYGYFAYSLPTT